MSALTFEIDGLNCASCVGRAEAALKGVKGVREVNVNLANHRAQVSFDGDHDVSAVQKALADAGKPMRIHTHHLQIEGMSCASCVGRVEAALKAVPDVLEASVNLPAQNAKIQSMSADAAPLIGALKSIGYAARPQNGTAPDTRAEDEANSARRATLIAAILTLPVFVLEMGGHVFPAFHKWVHQTIGMQNSWIIQFVFTTLVLIWPGRVFYQKGLPALIARAPDMNSLVVLGASAAYGFSVIALFAPDILPSGAKAVYFEAAAVIVTLILLGRFFEARAKGRTGAAIGKLVGLRPKTARVERAGAVVDVPVDEIAVGDLIHLKPGERVAVDGVVTQGDTWIDEAMISGEPVPVAKTIGAKVTGGTINGTGAVVYRATAVGHDTMLAQIITMVQDAQGARLPIQDLVNKITMWFVPVVLVIAVLTVAAWLWFGPTPALPFALVAGVSVLIIACPCAMGLATPMSIMVGTGRAADKGVLFRKGDALQALQSAQVVAFDKTGTLTEGRPVLVQIALFSSISEEDALTLAAAVESKSEHPISRAITQGAEDRALELPPVAAFQSITGGGVRGEVQGRAVLIGNAVLMKDHTIEVLPEVNEASQAASEQGQTAVLMAVDGAVVAIIVVADPIRQSARDTVKNLHKLGLKTAMISGDAMKTAQAVGLELGIDHVIGDVLPADKVAALRKLQSNGKVAFVGDGINDAPALAASDVGIAIGTGTDVAIETADVVLMSSDLGAVTDAFSISRATMRNIRQNLFWAFGYNVLLIPVAAGLLYPLVGVLLSPALAAGAMALSSVFVVTNALRLRRA